MNIESDSNRRIKEIIAEIENEELQFVDDFPWESHPGWERLLKAVKEADVVN